MTDQEVAGIGLVLLPRGGQEIHLDLGKGRVGRSSTCTEVGEIPPSESPVDGSYTVTGERVNLGVGQPVTPVVRYSVTLARSSTREEIVISVSLDWRGQQRKFFLGNSPSPVSTPGYCIPFKWGLWLGMDVA